MFVFCFLFFVCVWCVASIRDVDDELEIEFKQLIQSIKKQDEIGVKLWIQKNIQSKKQVSKYKKSNYYNYTY